MKLSPVILPTARNSVLHRRCPVCVCSKRCAWRARVIAGRKLAENCAPASHFEKRRHKKGCATWGEYMRAFRLISACQPQHLRCLLLPIALGNTAALSPSWPCWPPLLGSTLKVPLPPQASPPMADRRLHRLHPASAIRPLGTGPRHVPPREPSPRKATTRIILPTKGRPIDVGLAAREPRRSAGLRLSSVP